MALFNNILMVVLDILTNIPPVIYMIAFGILLLKNLKEYIKIVIVLLVVMISAEHFPFIQDIINNILIEAPNLK